MMLACTKKYHGHEGLFPYAGGSFLLRGVRFSRPAFPVPGNLPAARLEEAGHA